MKSDTSGETLDRRTLLSGTTSLLAAGSIGSILADRGVATPTATEPTQSPASVSATATSESLFPQSVASGGPTPSGVLCWTRLNPTQYAGGPVVLQIAPTPSFEEVTYERSIPATEIGPATDHTITVDCTGALASNTEYAYRFVADGVASNTGRCRTLPATDAQIERLSFAIATCQDYQNGYFGAFSQIAAEDVDFLLHLGDFIYEAADGRFAGSEFDDRALSLPSGNDVAHTLADFRYLYRQYRSDRHLQRALEQHTLIACWDDHEIANDRYWDDSTDSPRLPDHPQGMQPDAATQITADGIQAWIEMFPVRVYYEPNPTQQDLQDAFRLQHTLSFGSLATLVLTDERLYRDPPPGVGESDTPGRSMLGDDQRSWFLNTITEDTATWTVWANEVLSMPLTLGPTDIGSVLNGDAWDGFQHERDILTTAFADVENLVTLTGDIHTAMAGVQQRGDDFYEDRTPVGVEFVAPAITSKNLSEMVPSHDGLTASDISEPAVKLANPHVEFFDSSIWGYAVVEFTPNECSYTVYSVDKHDADNPAKTERIRLHVPAGAVQIER